MTRSLRETSGGVVVAYSGVHQAYQIAQASHEIGVLDCFLCSLYAERTHLGRALAAVLGHEKLASRSLAQFNGPVRHNPLPLLKHVLLSKVGIRSPSDWYAANKQFDKWASKKLREFDSRLFVGTETCALECFKVAKGRDMGLFLDCPQLHPSFIEPILSQAAEVCKIPHLGKIDSSLMEGQKAEEYALADRLLIYSDVHRRSFLQGGFALHQLFQCPLWVDPTLWFSQNRQIRKHGHLRALFVGSINLRKGIPFLLDAISRTSNVKLSLVGNVSEELRPMLSRNMDAIEIFPPKTKEQLRVAYESHDVLVLPSLGDSFGFVGLEAMACGMPVIVSDNCGVPVPDAQWRVPIMSTVPIEERLAMYDRDREKLYEDSIRAENFSRQFTPQLYRSQIARLVQETLKL